MSVTSFHRAMIMISNSTFEKNRAKASDSGALNLHECTACTLQINTSHFDSNEASHLGGSVAIFKSSGNVTFLNSDFKTNEAGSLGSAVAFRETSGSVIFFSSSFSRNEAVHGGAIPCRKD